MSSPPSTDLTPIQKAQAAAAAGRKRNASSSNTTTQSSHHPSSQHQLQKQHQKRQQQTANNLPLLLTKASPRDGDAWTTRLREEYTCLIKYVTYNKSTGNDWFHIGADDDKTGVKWSGRCWHYHDSLRYEFRLEFEVPVSYPSTNPEIRLPELEGKTAKMYRGGRVCLADHFTPLWNRNVPRFGIVHVLALGLGPWLAAEIPDLVAKGLIVPKN